MTPCFDHRNTAIYHNNYFNFFKSLVYKSQTIDLVCVISPLVAMYASCIVDSFVDHFSFFGSGIYRLLFDLSVFPYLLYDDSRAVLLLQCSGVLLTPCGAVITLEGAVSTPWCCTNTRVH